MENIRGVAMVDHLIFVISQLFFRCEVKTVTNDDLHSYTVYIIYISISYHLRQNCIDRNVGTKRYDQSERISFPAPLAV